MARAMGPLLCAALLGVLGPACGARGDEAATSNPTDLANPVTTAASESAATAAARFGDLASPCGPGTARLRTGEGPSTPGRIAIGVANDRSSTIRPGLNKDVWDAANAFVKWCNAQGGIAGLKIAPVDLDGQILQVQAAMARACTGVFAMVGGGFVQDDQEFSGQPGSDFARCGLVDIPAFAVSVTKSESAGQVQPLPNPAFRRPTQWIEDFARRFPTQSRKHVVVYGDLPSLQAITASYRAAVRTVGGIEQLPSISYPVAGLTDWGPLADRIISSGATSMHFVGEPANLASLMAALSQKRWPGKVLLETNLYDDKVFAKGAAAVEGIVVRLPFRPFEEAAENPATQQYLDLLGAYDPAAQATSLGMQSMSAWLLFASAATKCAAANRGVIGRACILDQARTFDGWTAGGLHAPSDPGSPNPTACGLLVVAKGGRWVRLAPAAGSADDDGDGYHCARPGIATVTPEDAPPTTAPAGG